MRWKPIFNADTGGTGGGTDTAPPGDPTLLGGDPATNQPSDPTPPPGDPNADPGKPDPNKPDPGKPEQPQEYQPFRIPEGMTYDDAQAKEFGALAKELGLNQEQAQKLVDYESKRWLGAIDEFEKVLVGERKKQADACRNHPELGGARLTESLGYASKFIDAFGGAALRVALNTTGAGDNPEIFAAFVKAGKLLAEDKYVSGSNNGQDTSFSGLAKTMFPNM